MSKSKDEREAYTKHLMSLGWQPATTMSADDKYQYAIALGTIAAAERDALQALVCEIAVIRRGSLDGGGYAFLSADLLARLDAAAKADQ